MIQPKVALSGCLSNRDQKIVDGHINYDRKRVPDRCAPTANDAYDAAFGINLLDFQAGNMLLALDCGG